MSRLLWLSLSLVAVLLFVAGCSDTISIATKPVTGTVTLDGTAVAGATVTFSPTGEAGRTATGLTDTSGQFSLTTVQAGDGAQPGSYQVIVAKTSAAGAAEAAPTSQEEGMKQMQEQMKSGGMGGLGRAPAEVKDELPAKYKAAATSGLEATVTEDGQNNFTFELSSS